MILDFNPETTHVFLLKADLIYYLMSGKAKMDYGILWENGTVSFLKSRERIILCPSITDLEIEIILDIKL